MEISKKQQHIANIHASARIEAGKSQEFMALELGVSKKTIQNWERGISSPSLLQSLEWFRILNMNAIQKIFEIIYPEKAFATRQDSSAEAVNKEFEQLCDVLSLEDKKALLYIFHGNHGSSAHSLIQLLLAHAHLPLPLRVTLADMIYSTYELHREAGSLICKDDTMPDMKNLERSRRQARISAINKEYGYSITDK